MSTWPEFLAHKPVNTRAEMGAYEFLWRLLALWRVAECFSAHASSPSSGRHTHVIVSYWLRQ